MRVATRGSELALLQARSVASLLGAGAETDLVVVDTTGDRRADVPIADMGGQGVFVKEVQLAVLEGRADVAVHSAKDLPSGQTPGMLVAAVPERGDPRDALVGASIEGLAPGAVVRTGSVRRRAQLASLRPDLTFAELRGNVPTRISRVEKGGAVVVAMAALERLGRARAATEVLDPSLVLPQVAQGALAVECRAEDEKALELLARIEHPPSRSEVDAERAFLARIGGSCDLPVGALARSTGPGELSMVGLLASLDGRVLLRARMTGSDPAALGSQLALELLGARGGSCLVEDVLTPMAAR